MNRCNDNSDMYPIVYTPNNSKLSTTNEPNGNKLRNADVRTGSPDSEGESSFNRGYCNVKILGSNDDSGFGNGDQVESENSIKYDTNEMSEADPLMSSLIQSKIWIDPSTSPYVYNYCSPFIDNNTNKCGIPRTVEQHNILDMGINTQPDSNLIDFDEEEFNSNVLFAQLPGEIMNEKMSWGKVVTLPDDIKLVDNIQLPEEINLPDNIELPDVIVKPDVVLPDEIKRPNKENNALKQLMSSSIQTASKESKTIISLGHDFNSGQTVQTMSYNDPKLKCAKVQEFNGGLNKDSLKTKKKIFQCDKCKQNFDEIFFFRQHLVGNLDNFKIPIKRSNELMKKEECKICGKHFNNQHELRSHHRGHGNPNKECSKCRKVFSSKFALKAHENIHSRAYPCFKCFNSYSSPQNLKTHLLKKHLLNVCPEEKCLYASKKKSHLEKHQEHCKTFVNSNENADTEDVTDILGSSQDHKGKEESVLGIKTRSSSSRCDTMKPSDGIMMSDEALTLPVETYSEAERIQKADNVISKVITYSIFLLSKEMARKHQNRNNCEVCPKTFKRIDELKRHLIEHVVKCTLAKVCHTAKFTKVDKYKAHLREHAKLTLYQCALCDKSFSDSSNFCKHKKIHEISLYQCDLCKRKFNSKRRIVQHIEIHNQKEPIHCKYCKKVFYFDSTLKKHIQSAHKRD